MIILSSNIGYFFNKIILVMLMKKKLIEIVVWMILWVLIFMVLWNMYF